MRQQKAVKTVVVKGENSKVLMKRYNNDTEIPLPTFVYLYDYSPANGCLNMSNGNVKNRYKF